MTGLTATKPNNKIIMRLTYENIKSNTEEIIAIIRAAAAGKQIQYNNGDGWSDCHMAGTFMMDVTCEYRIKPSPRLRPWKPEEVPVGAAYRSASNPLRRQIILGTTSMDVTVACLNENKISEIALEDFVKYEYSLDHGKTWLPCGVEVCE